MTAIAAKAQDFGSDSDGQDSGGQDSGDQDAGGPSSAPAATDPTALASLATGAQAASASAAAPATLATATPAAVASQIAAQFVQKVNGKSTQFEVALDPAGLGRVNVKVQVSASGQVTASLSFDNPAAAADAQSRASELHQALEQAGFNLGQGGLSFNDGGAGSGGLGRQDGQASQGQSAATVSTVSITEAPAIPPPAYGSAATSGLDIKI
jgi:hypothetical protein